MSSPSDVNQIKGHELAISVTLWCYRALRRMAILRRRHLLTRGLCACNMEHFSRPKKCEPGETHMEDCNICKCNNDGTSFACTRRGCPPKQEGGKNLERHTRGE
ncbi:unnamed protein product [Timema podura]|uniref:Pacifastin domain-containing protein n=1 Tax=Timema podura TaxID=61482 RepID=A0ABN7P4S1_TIMPD|nr:unnamed protein product [Timema podura]